MNNFLLDTHVFLWLNFSPEKLDSKLLKQLQDRENQISVSVISFWEISLKYQLGKLSLSGVLPDELLQSAQDMGIEIANINPEEFSTFFKLPLDSHHKDPFDRLIVWQCINQNKILVSHDSKLNNYKRFGLQIIP